MSDISDNRFYREPPAPMKTRIERLKAAIEGECDGLAITDEAAEAALKYVDCLGRDEAPDWPQPTPTDNRPELRFPYTNWRGEFSVRRVLPIRVWFGSTDWHPEPQWLLRALDLDKGGERDFAFSQINKPEPVTEEDGAIGWCEGCSKAIREGERHHTGAEVLLCEACAPSYSDMHSSPELFRNSDDEPMTLAQANVIVAKHLAAGGNLEDKVVSA